jgi:hypothetical protein
MSNDTYQTYLGDGVYASYDGNGIEPVDQMTSRKFA